LAFPEDFIGVTAEIDAAFWVQGVGAALTEALQPKLQERFLNIERGKHLIADWSKLRGLGLSQEQSLSAYLSACEAAKRPDLARFLLRALAEVLSSDLTPAFWNGGLQSAAAPPRLADRLETQRQGLAALRQLERLAGWARNYAGTKFFDDDYHVAQLWLVDWEQYRGEEIAGLAQNLLRQLEPLRLSAPAAASGTENAAVNGAPTKRGE
jgi:hypothetical protein